MSGMCTLCSSIDGHGFHCCRDGYKPSVIVRRGNIAPARLVGTANAKPLCSFREVLRNALASTGGLVMIPEMI